MAKKKKSNRGSKFNRPDNPYWNPDDEVDYREAYGDEDEEGSGDRQEIVMVNEIFLQSFVDNYQPERDERIDDVRALSMGELRDVLQAYRTFDSKMPDPLPYYLAALANHGFGVRMGFSGEMVMLVSRRNNGRAMDLDDME